MGEKADDVTRISVNGKTHEVDVEPDTPLLWVLRDTIGLTGTKYGCGIAQCGACTVHIDGVATRSCQVEVGTVGSERDHDHRSVGAERQAPSGAESLGRFRRAAMRVLPERHDHGGRGLLAQKPKPTDAEIDEAITNICRCGTYQRIRTAIHALANA